MNNCTMHNRLLESFLALPGAWWCLTAHILAVRCNWASGSEMALCFCSQTAKYETTLEINMRNVTRPKTHAGMQAFETRMNIILYILQPQCLKWMPHVVDSLKLERLPGREVCNTGYFTSGMIWFTWREYIRPNLTRLQKVGKWEEWHSERMTKKTKEDIFSG